MPLIYELYDKGYSVDFISKEYMKYAKQKGIRLTDKSARLFVETIISSKKRREKIL